MYTDRYRKASRRICTYILRKKFRYGALIKVMSKKQHLLVKAQALVRGHICRQANSQKVAKIKRNGVTGTKTYKSASKIAAAIKGFLFRKRRKNALNKL
jgi:hypothetical protein